MRRILFALLLLPLTIYGKQSAEAVISSYLVRPRSNQQMDQIAKTFEVVRRLPEGFEVYVPVPLVRKFMRLAPQAKLLVADIRQEILQSLLLDQASGEVRYRSMEQVVAYLQELQQKYPQIAKLDTYGQSKNGKPLYVLKISDHVAVDEDEKELLMTAATHGDEIITVEVLLGLVQKLVEGYQGDARIRQMIEQRELYFIPVVNPEGFLRRDRYSEGVDPNRSYPLVTGGQASKTTVIENLIRFFHSRNISGSIDFHAYGELVMFPWGYSTRQTTHDGEFAALAGQMAQGNGYQSGQISRILYTAPGSSADYYYWKKNTQAFGIEVAQTKAPRSSEIPRIVEEAREMTWKFIEGAGF